MSWLRLDDGFASNHKIAALTDRQLRVWLRVLCHCARAQDPTVDEVVIQEVSGADKRFVDRCVELELLDPSGLVYEIHDWVTYQPKDATGADRQAKWRARQALRRNADRNGNRNVESNAADRYADRDESVTSRAGARARPVPYQSLEKETSAVSVGGPVQTAPDSSKKKPRQFCQHCQVGGGHHAADCPTLNPNPLDF